MTDQFTHGHAVVIGMGADLPVTITDAQGIATLLRDPARCAYPPDRVQLLTGPGACRDDVLKALDGLATQVKDDPDATAVVYFSGHGVETLDYYFLPYGYNVADLPHTAVSGAEFTDKLRAIQARKLLVLLDCCKAGGIGGVKDPTALPFPKSPAPPGMFDALKAGGGRVLIASSRKDEYSRTGVPYSIFTDEFLKAMAGHGAFERDGYARVLDAAMWVGRKVPARTADQQNPIIKVSNLEDNFALAYYAGGDKTPKALEWDAGAEPFYAGLDAAQLASWRVQWQNYRENLLLIEERMSEYVEFTAIPLQLVKNKRQTEARIVDLERRLAVNADS
jgi:hypothetical protein